PVLNFFSSLAPMRYAVDLMRSTYYSGTDEYEEVVLLGPLTNLAVMAIMFGVFLVIGTALFVRKERNR
ncbi:MAG TPA: ABC transporter permease, partial [Actinomycetota bacterium]|nr:ABC transporter permease [Actinomycetota bacterium]